MASTISRASLLKLRTALSADGQVWRLIASIRHQLRQCEEDLSELSVAVMQAEGLLNNKTQKRSKSKPPVAVVIGTDSFMLTSERLLPGSIKSHHTRKVKR
jgi:hypothetical protein